MRNAVYNGNPDTTSAATTRPPRPLIPTDASGEPDFRRVRRDLGLQPRVDRISPAMEHRSSSAASDRVLSSLDARRQPVCKA